MDAALRYIALLDTLIDAYHTKIAPQLMHDPTTTVAMQCSLKVFIDDVVLHAMAPNVSDILTFMLWAQNQLTWWDQLVVVQEGSSTIPNVVVICTLGNQMPIGFCDCRNQQPPHRISCSHWVQQPNQSISYPWTKEPDTSAFISPMTAAHIQWKIISGKKHFFTPQHFNKLPYHIGKLELSTAPVLSWQLPIQSWQSGSQINSGTRSTTCLQQQS